jgi:hypothetical protein
VAVAETVAVPVSVSVSDDMATGRRMLDARFWMFDGSRLAVRVRAR